MKIDDFGLKFSSAGTARRTDLPTTSEYVLVANGIPWYSVRELDFGLIISSSPEMNALVFTQTHPLHVWQHVNRAIVDCKVKNMSAVDKINLVGHTIQQRMGVGHADLVTTIQQWVDAQQSRSIAE